MEAVQIKRQDDKKTKWILLAACILGGIASVLSVIALAAPYWMVWKAELLSSGNNLVMEYCIGLFRACLSGGDVVEECFDIESDWCLRLVGALAILGFILGFIGTAFGSLRLIFSVVYAKQREEKRKKKEVVVMVVVEEEEKKKKEEEKNEEEKKKEEEEVSCVPGWCSVQFDKREAFAMCLLIGAGALYSVVGVIVFGTVVFENFEQRKELVGHLSTALASSSFQVEKETKSLGWSFFVCIASMCFGIISCIVLGVGVTVYECLRER